MPHPGHVSLPDTVRIIRDFFGDRAAVYVDSSDTEHTTFILYDAIAVEAGIDPHRGSLTLVIPLAERVHMSSPLARGTTLLTGVAQIREALQSIDDYCRLRLPDKYLEAFDAAMLRSNSPDMTASPDE